MLFEFEVSDETALVWTTDSVFVSLLSIPTERFAELEKELKRQDFDSIQR